MQQPPTPPRHGLLYWTLFILFFPVTLPYVALRWSILSIRNTPARPIRKHHHRHAPTMGQQLRQFGRTMRGFSRMANKARYMQQHGGRRPRR